MNVQEFKRWAEGQRGMAAAPVFEPVFQPVETVPSEQIADHGEPRAEAKAGTEGSQSRAGRLVATLRWGK